MERGAKPGVLQRMVQHVAWRIFISLVYITGLTLLIPFVFLFVFPQELNIVAPSTSPVLIWVAAAMIVGSFIITFAYKKSFGATLKSLGRVTFIPGLIGLVFSIFGKDIVLLYMAATIPGFQNVQQIMTLYVDNAVPHVRYLTMGFFVLGIVFWLLGDKLESDAAVGSARRAVYGLKH